MGHWGIKGALLALTLAACSAPPEAPPVPPAPKSSAPARATKPEAKPRPAPSVASQSLASFYASKARRLRAQGKLRQERTPSDAPLNAALLQKDFELIAFSGEHADASTQTKRLLRWQDPVRIRIFHGATVATHEREAFNYETRNFAGRLASLTGHSVSTTASDENFLLFHTSLDDVDMMRRELARALPRLSPETVALLTSTDPEIECLVAAFTDATGRYRKAVAFVRAEHPPILRTACIEEELAQGMGLYDDSPLARPSVFNDDDEFARLTRHDELMLKMLYDPRLSAGVTLETARPILQTMTAEFFVGVL